MRIDKYTFNDPHMVLKAEADLGFSRGGGGRIFKKISKILTTIFLGRPN